MYHFICFWTRFHYIYFHSFCWFFTNILLIEFPYFWSVSCFIDLLWWVWTLFMWGKCFKIVSVCITSFAFGQGSITSTFILIQLCYSKALVSLWSMSKLVYIEVGSNASTKIGLVYQTTARKHNQKNVQLKAFWYVFYFQFLKSHFLRKGAVTIVSLILFSMFVHQQLINGCSCHQFVQKALANSWFKRSSKFHYSMWLNISTPHQCILTFWCNVIDRK